MHTATREDILNQIDLFDVSIDTNRELLSTVLFTLKALRNAVAHNNIIFDTRFKDRNISNVLKRWVEKETGIQNITLYSLVDYIIIICCLLKRIDFNNTRAKDLLHQYKEQNALLKSSVTPEIYSMIIQQNVASKITSLEAYLNS